MTMRWHRPLVWCLAGALLALTGASCDQSPGVAPPADSVRRRLTEVTQRTPYPRICMFWTHIRGDDSLEGYAKHDLVLTSAGWLGLEWAGASEGLADGFVPESIEPARKKMAALRALNPNVVILCEINFYEYYDEWLPEDHPWWLRANGEKEQFWPGTHRMDWYNPEFREHIVKQSVALDKAGVDGVYYDNLRDEPEPWIAMLSEVRKRTGDGFLIMANYGYAIDEYDFAAPYLNGIMYESGWSHDRTEWDDTIAAMRHSESLLRRPTISAIERFEDIEGSDEGPLPRHRRPEKRDPAARRWSLCYTLIIGDYYYIFSDNTYHGHDWYPEYDVKIGLPAGEGERVSPFVWKRRYDKALVVVNLPGAALPYEIDLDRPARDSLTGESGTSFTLPPGDGRILVFE
jgi:hypothetical protein